jgi:hypothetical protein
MTRAEKSADGTFGGNGESKRHDATLEKRRLKKIKLK